MISQNGKLFDELKTWSSKKNSFSVNDFLKSKGIAFSDFELIANGSKKFMKIWGVAESQAWENVKNALFTKSLPRKKIAEYIKEVEAFHGEDSDEVIRNLESGQLSLELYLTAIGDTDALKKYGRIGIKMNDFEALMKCNLEREIITQEQYNDAMIVDEDEADRYQKD